MDVSKLLWLLAQKKLYLARLDQLQDEFEGSSTRRTLDGIEKFLKGIGQESGFESMRRIYRESRAKTYVNCWYLGDAESEAMWRLYCPATNGVAIQTTYHKLADSIENEESVFLGRVTYADYETLHFRDSNLFYPVMHKRIAFAHENEVRLVRHFDSNNEGNQPLGVEVNWDPISYVDSIFVDPYASEYHYQAVRTAVATLAPDWSVEIQWSEMKATPVLE